MTAKTASTTTPAPGMPGGGRQATEMLDLMMRLADLLTHETERVRSGHVRDIAPLQQEKLRLTQLYQDKVREFASTGGRIENLPAPLRAQIVAASGSLAEATAKNERTLRVGREATRRLLEMVVASVKDRLRPMSRYDGHRALRPARIVPCALDRRL